MFSLINKYLAYVYAGAAVLILAGALWVGWWVQGMRKDNASLHEANTALTVALTNAQKLRASEQKIAKEDSEKRSLLATQSKAQDAKLHSAITANKVWADEMVPAGVLDALGL